MHILQNRPHLLFYLLQCDVECRNIHGFFIGLVYLHYHIDCKLYIGSNTIIAHLNFRSGWQNSTVLNAGFARLVLWCQCMHCYVTTLARRHWRLRKLYKGTCADARDIGPYSAVRTPTVLKHSTLHSMLKCIVQTLRYLSSNMIYVAENLFMQCLYILCETSLITFQHSTLSQHHQVVQWEKNAAKINHRAMKVYCFYKIKLNTFYISKYLDGGVDCGESGQDPHDPLKINFTEYDPTQEIIFPPKLLVIMLGMWRLIPTLIYYFYNVARWQRACALDR